RPARGRRPPGARAAMTGVPACRAGRVYRGWQYAVAHPAPGPPPRRPVPAEPEQVNPGWLAAQRREGRLLTRYWKMLTGASLAGTALVLGLGPAGLLNPALTLLRAAGLVTPARPGRRALPPGPPGPPRAPAPGGARGGAAP